MRLLLVRTNTWIDFFKTHAVLRNLLSTRPFNVKAPRTFRRYNDSSNAKFSYNKQDISSKSQSTKTRSINELSDFLSVPPVELLKAIKDLGKDIDGLAVPLELDYELCKKFNKQSPRRLVPRPPVVTIMGHVDHGKTTLLDKLRNSCVAAGEAGGITQHIGAFVVPVPTGEKITFIDTPGHAAFESMRARGANITDIVVLVVAADDGVKTQTVESIRHAVHADVPIIVAVNKIDKPQKNIDILKRQLLTHGVQLEEYGGDVQLVEISALKGTNLDSLMEAIVTLAEMEDLKACNEGTFHGVVIESKLDKALGPLATTLVQSGTLVKGHVIVAGNSFAKVREMFSDKGEVIGEALPSTPVKVIGWKQLPLAGEKVIQVESEREANRMISLKQAKEENERKSSLAAIVIKSTLKDVKYDATNKLDIVIRADVDGSVQAIVDAINTYKCNKIKLSLLRASVGAVTENDIKMAHTFQGLVLGFNVNISKDIQQLAKQLNVPFKNHNIIYNLLQEVKDEMNSRLPKLKQEDYVGDGQILKVFKLTGSKKAYIAGCRVKGGEFKKESFYRIKRGNNTLFEGKLTSMKRGIEDFGSIKKEQECGLGFGKFTGFEEGDRIECFNIKMVEDNVNWNWGF